MIFQGISMAWAAAGALAVSAALVALHFLREKLPGREIPGVMLWQAAMPRPHRRFLWEKLTRLLAMLLPLLAAWAALAALTEPVYDPKPRAVRTVLVAAPDAVGAAARRYVGLDPLRTAVVLAEGDGVTLAEFGVPAGRLTEPAAAPVGADTAAVAALAARMAGPKGRVVWFGPQMPEWLPPGAGFIRCGNAATARTGRPLRVVLRNAAPAVRRSAAALPGITLTEDAEAADVVWHSAADGGFDDFYRSLVASGIYSESCTGQEPAASPASPELPRPRAKRLSGWLFALAAGCVLADLWLWHKRRTV